MISEFSGEYTFLSNFYDSPILIDNILFSCVESAYQAQKTTSRIIRKKFASMKAKEAKKFGRQVILRDDWDDIKKDIMEYLVREKFNQNPILRNKLLGTGNEELQEGNYWRDTYWGVCNGVGENNLGKILMKIREEIKS